MRKILSIMRRSALTILAGLILTIAFGAQTTQAQSRGVRPYVDCVEREFVNGAATGNYIAYFGYTSAEVSPVTYFWENMNNFFDPVDIPQSSLNIFYPGVHPRVVSIVVPIGTDETWILGSGSATASFQASKFCGTDGTNSRLITYQGKLSDGAAAANGTYDLRFQLFNQATGGSARTTQITLDDVPVTNGVFTVQLDLGANSLPPGGSGAATPNLKLNPAILDAENSFLEISVRAGNASGAFTTLTPRQPLTAVPLAMRANTANNAFRAVTADNLGGVAANQFVKTDDGRLTDARTPTPGNANYIQNTTTTQANSSFNVSGTGEADAFNARNEFRIGGNYVLSIRGTGNLFAGELAGGPIGLGSNNAFVGYRAGYFNRDGSNNVFVGYLAGGGSRDSSNNVFVGYNAGQVNSAGSNNTLLGSNAIVGSGNLTYAAAVGSGAIVNSNNTVVLGRPADSVQIPGILAATTTNISGTIERLLNVQGSSNIGTWLTLNNTTTGGRQWSIISTGASNGEGAGKLLFYDLTNAAGRFQLSSDGATVNGNLIVTGAISGATKNFEIDHPLDPLNKTLTYTSVESPDMMNIYNGNITTDAGGEAIVKLPDYFEALNRDFRYQLTVIGTFAQAVVAEKINGNQFKIKTDKPNVEVSWQVTGVRRDKFAEDNRPKVEETKSANDKGKCIYAPACGNKSEENFKEQK